MWHNFYYTLTKNKIKTESLFLSSCVDGSHVFLSKRSGTLDMFVRVLPEGVSFIFQHTPHWSHDHINDREVAIPFNKHFFVGT